MILRPLSTFLGIHELPERAQGLVQRFVMIVIFIDLVSLLSTTFFVLFVIDSIGIAQLGMLLAIRFLIQAALDYPSGVLGDWVGHKWVLFTAYLTFALSYVTLVFADSFFSFLIVYSLFAFASSQQSGALMAWFENNYKAATGDTDPERKTYKFFLGKWQVIT